jgi:hypothetical protein
MLGFKPRVKSDKEVCRRKQHGKRVSPKTKGRSIQFAIRF